MISSEETRPPSRIATAERRCEAVRTHGTRTMKTATFSIGGMHCASCAARNERTLRKLAGVRTASVNYGTHSVRVEFDEAAVSERALHDAIVDNGYQVLTREFAQDHKAQA